MIGTERPRQCRRTLFKASFSFVVYNETTHFSCYKLSFRVYYAIIFLSIRLPAPAQAAALRKPSSFFAFSPLKSKDFAFLCTLLTFSLSHSLLDFLHFLQFSVFANEVQHSSQTSALHESISTEQHNKALESVARLWYYNCNRS